MPASIAACPEPCDRSGRTPSCRPATCSVGCFLQMGMLEESLVWSMLPQPAPMGSSMGQQSPSDSSMGGAPPSRSPGPAGGTTEQWSEIFPCPPDGSAGLKERGWAAHLRSAARAAGGIQSAAAATGGAVRLLSSSGGQRCFSRVPLCSITCMSSAWQPRCLLIAP